MAQIVSKAVGIDLGTTNSAVAVMDPADADILIHRDPVSRSQTTPSCVWRNPQTGEIVVGRKAFMRVGSAPEPIRSIKRLMGQRTTVPLSGENDRMSPEEVSAAILAEMKRQITEDIADLETESASWAVDRAIVTVPAYFDQPQIEATRKAAELAGLEVVDLLHEPTAAAAHYCWRTSTRDGAFLVYDLGGGTFDVSVVRCTAGAFEVLGISGNNRLGGDDIDAALARHILGVLQNDGWALDLDLEDEEDRLRFNQLKRLAEGAKKALSDTTEYVLRNDGMVKDKLGNPVVIDIPLERPDLEAIARPFVERTLVYCDEAIDRARQRAGIALADVDQIILAGGSTHMPLVRELVRDGLCSPSAERGRAKCDEPVYEKVDTIVACGAAIRAAAVGGLMVYDADRTLRVSFRGTASTDMTATHVGGTVEALDADLDLAGGYVRLTAPGYEAEAELSEAGVFSFTGIPLQAGAGNQLAFEVVDGAGNPRAVIGRTVTHSASTELIDPTSTAVNAKAIELEVTRDGKAGRAVLVPALAPLPMSAEHTFDHPGGVETVVFSFYQGGTRIEVIKVPVPLSTPRGTPVTLDLHMDRQYLITVRGRIDERTFEAVIEPAPERAMPDAEEIAELERKFRDSVGYLPAGERNKARIKWAMARKSLHDAMERADREQAVHDLEEMEGVIAGLGEGEAPLDPPRREFDQLVQECVDLNAYAATEAAGHGVPHDPDEMARAIEAQRRFGEMAFAAADQKSYGEAFAQLNGYRSHLIGLFARTRPQGAEPTEAERAMSVLKRASELAADVRQLAEAAGRRDLADETASIEQHLADLRPDMERDPQRVREKAAAWRARLEQMENIVKAGPRVAELPPVHRPGGKR